MLKYAISAALVGGLIFLYDRGMLPYTNARAAKLSIGAK